MNDSLNIKISKNFTNKIKEFYKKEWHIADIEHYGKDVVFEKKKYKFVAKNNEGNIVGALDLVLEVNVALIEGLLVSSKYKRQGIGKKLMINVENFAKKNKCTKVWLETDEGWEAEKFYKALGYKITGTHEKHFFNNRSLIFTKFL